MDPRGHVPLVPEIEVQIMEKMSLSTFFMLTTIRNYNDQNQYCYTIYDGTVTWILPNESGVKVCCIVSENSPRSFLLSSRSQGCSTATALFHSFIDKAACKPRLIALITKRNPYLSILFLCILFRIVI